MTIRKFTREELQSEPHDVRYADIYPWDAIADTPFSASLAVVEPGGRTMLHDHAPAETFVICRGSGTMVHAGREAKADLWELLGLVQTEHWLRPAADGQRHLYEVGHGGSRIHLLRTQG